MPLDSWMTPEEAQALATTATAMIDAALVGSGLSREAYWAAVRKGYNTPYNDPQAKDPQAKDRASGVLHGEPAAAVLIDLAEGPLPVAAMAAHAGAVEIHAG